jgi:hypothetical protein
MPCIKYLCDNDFVHKTNLPHWRNIMRKLSDTFIYELKEGFLAGITQITTEDHDLNLEIRDNKITLYYKGHGLLNLAESNKLHYRVDINKKFTGGVDLPHYLNDIDSTNHFIKYIPILKQNIIKIGKHSLEMEYEQMVIRANNYEPKNSSEYFIIDRQYAVDKSRFDLTGFYWKSRGRNKNQVVDMCLMEVKFGLNTDINEVHQQLERYYEDIKPRAASIAEEGETILKQKLELGLYDQSADRLEAMKTLCFSRDISHFQFILLLVDFNPYSKILNLDNLKSLPFASQVRIFYSGFAMWHQNIKPIIDETRLE